MWWDSIFASVPASGKAFGLGVMGSMMYDVESTQLMYLEELVNLLLFYTARPSPSRG